MRDGFGREIDCLRISVTDRCNLRCVYCMPEYGACGLRPEELLTFDEIERTVRTLAGLGVKHIRLTGGEPMMRAGCLALAERLRAIPGVESLGMTTNALLLRGRMAEVQRAGIDALNISLDAADENGFARMTRGHGAAAVLAAIDEAAAQGLHVKINVVPVRGLNEEGLVDLAALAQARRIDVRFIELMPLGCGAALGGVPPADIQARLEAAFGPLAEEAGARGHGPARYVRPAGFAGTIGFISPLSHAFCDRCSRVRLTADGFLKLCLNHSAGLDVRALLRGGISDADLTGALREAIAKKPCSHGFSQEIADPERRRMYEIGG